MSIHWFTFFAQMINFLVLVWLLKRFLYGPITRAMTKREQKIAAKLNDADAAKLSAQQQASAHAAKIQELEQTRENLLAEAKVEVQQWQTEHIQMARSDVEKTRKEWFDGLIREQDAFVQELQRRTADHVYDATRKILSEIADANLEVQATTAFLHRLEQLETPAKQALISALNESDDTVVIASAFPLPMEQQERIINVLREKVDADVQVQFTCHPESICGIELKFSGRKLSWTINEALETLEDDLSRMLQAGLVSTNHQNQPLESHAEIGSATHS